MESNLQSAVHVLVADDHKLFRDGLVATLRHIQGIGLIHQASNGLEVLEVVKTRNCHLAFMDINMPGMDGISVTKKIIAINPSIKVVALSMHDDQKHIIDMFDAGAVGYLLKNTDKDELTQAIRLVMSGRRYYSPSVSGMLVEKAIEHHKRIEQADNVLTEREMMILQYIYQELTTKQIGQKMNISEKTVEGYRKTLMQKTGAKNIAALVKYAIKNGLTGELGL